MSNAFSRSWEITKATFSVIKHDKELLLFPILSMIFSLLFIVVLLLPTSVFLAFMSSGAVVFQGLDFLILFLLYLILAFVATFFNVCVVYTTKIRFSGGNATIGESIKFAFSKFRLILYWSLVSATVGVILRAIENSAERFGTVGKVIVHIFSSILGMVWSIITIFVIPVMVYEDLGPFDAIKRSSQVIRKTWGESLIRYFGLGLVQLIFFIGGLVFFVILGMLAYSLGSIAFIVVVCLGVLYLLGIILIFSIANTIFNTALYVYENTGKIPGEFSKEELDGAFKSRKKNSILG